jgi:hypothetical protein
MLCIFGKIGFTLSQFKPYIPNQNEPKRSILCKTCPQCRSFNALVIILLVTETIVQTSTQIDIYEVILKSFYKDMANYYENIDSNCESNIIKQISDVFIDYMQRKYICCKFDSPQDWYNRDLKHKFKSRELPHCCCPISYSVCNCHHRSGLAVCVLKGLSNSIDYTFIGHTTEKARKSGSFKKSKTEEQTKASNEDSII